MRREWGCLPLLNRKDSSLRSWSHKEMIRAIYRTSNQAGRQAQLTLACDLCGELLRVECLTLCSRRMHHSGGITIAYSAELHVLLRLRTGDALRAVRPFLFSDEEKVTIVENMLSVWVTNR